MRAKFKVGDRLYWTDSTIGKATGIVLFELEETGSEFDAVWMTEVVGSKSGPVDPTAGNYPVYLSDRPTKRAHRQRVDAGPMTM